MKFLNKNHKTITIKGGYYNFTLQIKKLRLKALKIFRLKHLSFKN